jgi:hypothetical protein
MAVVVQAEKKAVQFLIAPVCEPEAVIEVLLPPAFVVVLAAAVVSKAVRVEVLSGKKVETSWFEFQDVVVVNDSLEVFVEYGPLRGVTEWLEKLLGEVVITGSLSKEVINDAPQSITRSTDIDPDEGRLNGLPFLVSTFPGQTAQDLQV